MATTTIYTIESTDGEVTLVIQPRTINGANGVLRNTDLTLYGNATPNWGERFNENFYRLAENFATEESAAATPKNSTDFGEIGWGVNAPLQGQLWYNKTDNRLYLQQTPTSSLETTAAVWEVMPMIDDVNALITSGIGGIGIGDIPGLQADLDSKVDRAGDTSLTGIHSWPNLHLNLGNGNITVGPDIKMDAVGLLAANQGIYLMVDDDNDGNGGFNVIKGSTAIDGSEIDLFKVSNNGLITQEINATTYAGLVTAGGDDSIPNKKWVSDTIAGGGDKVDVTGDTMTGALEINIPAAPSDDPILKMRSESGPSLGLYTDNVGAYQTTVPPAITMYNPDNDSLLAGRPANHFPYMRLNNRDGTFFRFEADADDLGASKGGNTYKLLESFQSNGELRYYGHPTDGTATNVISTPNASVANVGANIKNLATVEYVNTAGGIANVFTSGQYSPVSGNVYTLAHGLGGVPDIILLYLICVIPYVGYNSGDVILMNPTVSDYDEGSVGGNRSSNMIKASTTQITWGFANENASPNNAYIGRLDIPGVLIAAPATNFNSFVKAIKF